MFGKLFNIFVIGALLPLTVNTDRNEVCEDPRCIRTAETFLKHMNPTYLPCENFYEFMCGKFSKWNPLGPGQEVQSAFITRSRYVDEKVLEYLKDDKDANIIAVQKARSYFKNCMDEATIEEVGEYIVPLELNSIGLPMRPPFNGPLHKEYNFSRLLGNVHRHSVFATFLFDLTIVPYEEDYRKNYIYFDYTPSTHQFRKEENPTQLEPFASRQPHFNNQSSEKMKEEERALLAKTMRKVVDYMYRLTNTRITKKMNKAIENRIMEVVDFLLQLMETKKFINKSVEGKFGQVTMLTTAQLQKITDDIMGEDTAQIKINWLDYFETLFEGVHDDARKILDEGREPIIINNLKQFQETLKVISKASSEVLICATWWRVIQSVSHLAGSELRKIYDDHHVELNKQEILPRQSRCVNSTKYNFSYLFGAVLVFKDENSRNDRVKAVEMLSLLREAFQDSITKSTWLDSSTKMAAINKLQYIAQLVSFQNWMTDGSNINYSNINSLYETTLVFPGNHYATQKLQKTEERDKNLQLLHKDNEFISGSPVSGLLPIDVNATYLTSHNSIDVPIGILGPPFYGLGLEALNFGSIGVFMAHEFGHALDNMGRTYNPRGQKKMWWKKRAYREYDKKAQCFENSYNEILIPEANRKVDGKLTLGENLSDYTGFTQSLKAYRKYVKKYGTEKLLPYFERYSHEKLFTMSFASTFCETLSTSFSKWLLENDVHAPGRARILGVLRNSVEFAEIWGCFENSGMNPKEKCLLW